MCIPNRLSVLALSMASFDRSSELSASKLRRMRAAAIKQRLYLAAKETEPLLMIQSQLAMLTSAIDYVAGYIYTTHAMTPNVEGSCFDPSATAFTPTGSTFNESQFACMPMQQPQPQSIPVESAPNDADHGTPDKDCNAFPIRWCKCRKSLRDCSCQWELCEGATVILCGLQKVPELNGEVAFVERSSSEDGRWSLRLQNGDGKRVKPENMRANPREIAAEMFTDVRASLNKFDGVLEQLNSNALDAEAKLASVGEQQQALDEMPGCPTEMLSKVGGLLSSIVLQLLPVERRW